MGKHKRILAIALATGLGIAISGAASAQGGMGYGHQGGPGMMGYGQAGMGRGMMGYGQHGMGPGMMGYGHHGMGPGMMGYDHYGMGPGMMGPGMMQQLDPEQRRQMRELMEQHRPAQFERMEKLANLRQKLMVTMSTDSPDPEQIQDLHGQMGELQGEMMAEMARMRGRMLDLLTDEQRAQLKRGATAPDSGQ